METTVIATIITVLGTGLLAGFGYFMKHLVDGIAVKIDKLEAGLNAKIDKLEAKVDKLEAKVDNLADELRSDINELRSDINTLQVSVAKIETTLQEHGTKLQHMMNHGERISALEGATFSTAT